MNMLKILFVFSLMLTTANAETIDTPLANLAQEARAHAIFNEIRCTVCQSESINDSAADMARDLRQLVRDKIRAGWNDRQIETYIRARYGDFILLRPPFQPNTWVLWLCPLLFFGLATLGVVRFLRRSAQGGGR